MMLLASTFMAYSFYCYPSKATGITAILLTAFICIFSLSLYLHWGNSQSLSQYYFQKNHSAEINAEIRKYKSPQELIAKMKAVLKERPHSAEGWFLLGRLYHGTDQYLEALQAYSKAIEVDNTNIDYKLQYAQADFFAHNQQLSAVGSTYLQEVLKEQPNNPEAIKLIALNAFASKNYQCAIDNWELLLNDIPADTPNGQVIMRAIREAQKRL